MTDKSKLRDAEWLREKYWDDGLSQAEIGELVGVSQTTVSYWFDQHDDLEPRSRGAAASYPELDDEEWLRERFVDRDMTIQAIADELGCGRAAVRYRLHQFGIIDDISTADGGWSRADKRLSDPDWLSRQLYAEERTEAEIAEDIGVAPNTVLYWRRRLAL